MKKLVSLMVVAAFSCGAVAGLQNFENPENLSGWWFNQGSTQLSTAKNHTPGGSTSVALSGSSWYTLPQVATNSLTLEYWFYNTGTDGYNGTYEMTELVVRDSADGIVSQTWLAPCFLREYVAGGQGMQSLGGAGAVIAKQWNKAVCTFDFAAGTYAVNINNGAFTWSTNKFGSTNGAAGTGIKSFAWSHTNNNGSVYYLDDVTVVPEPATMAILGLGSLLIVRKKKA